MSKKITIVKQGDISHLPEITSAIVHEGIIYCLTKENLTLYVLNQSLQVVKQVEVPEAESTLYLINILYINNYPHLVLFPAKQTINTKSFLVKLPTKFNRNYLIFTIKGIADFFRILSFNEDITTSGDLNLKGLLFSTDKARFVQENKASLAFLSANMDEITEFVQGHSAGIPFPVVQKLIKEPASVLEGIWNYGNNFFMLFQSSPGNYIIQIRNEDKVEDNNVSEIPFNTGNATASFIQIYEKDKDVFVGLTILQKENKQYLGMLEIME